MKKVIFFILGLVVYVLKELQNFFDPFDDDDSGWGFGV